MFINITISVVFLEFFKIKCKNMERSHSTADSVKLKPALCANNYEIERLFQKVFVASPTQPFSLPFPVHKEHVDTCDHSEASEKPC